MEFPASNTANNSIDQSIGGLVSKNLTGTSKMNSTASLVSQIAMNKSYSIENATSSILEDHLDRIQLVADIGYLLSLFTLVFALLILTCIKRLRCPKNSLHLQLFISFIVRCSFHLIQRLFIHGQYNSNYPIDLDSALCKAITVIWQYTLLANYNWILMEGVYLYSLIFFTSISPYGPSILGYIVFGWTMPLVCIIPWIVAKINYENTSCWLTNVNQAYFWILRAPITISILLNFIIYIRIVLVLYSKIFSGAMTLQTTKRNTENNYKKLLRSTLVLIPLFGVHYTALLLFQQWAEYYKFDLAEVIWLYVETLFSSCQGCIVACLYCFLNDEVHQEIKRLWRRYQPVST